MNLSWQRLMQRQVFPLSVRWGSTILGLLLWPNLRKLKRTHKEVWFVFSDLSLKAQGKKTFRSRDYGSLIKPSIRCTRSKRCLRLKKMKRLNLKLRDIDFVITHTRFYFLRRRLKIMNFYSGLNCAGIFRNDISYTCLGTCRLTLINFPHWLEVLSGRIFSRKKSTNFKYNEGSFDFLLRRSAFELSPHYYNQVRSNVARTLRR